MGELVFIGFALVVAGIFIISVVRADASSERAYGLLALALLAAIALGFLWPPVFSMDAYVDSWGANSLPNALMVGFFFFCTILAVALLGIVGLIEMAIARQWWWFATLLVAMALIAATIFLRPVPDLAAIFPFPNSFLQRDALWLAGEAVVLLVCAGYGVRATWFRSWPAA
jgi:hypothetical protein